MAAKKNTWSAWGTCATDATLVCGTGTSTITTGSGSTTITLVTSGDTGSANSTSGIVKSTGQIEYSADVVVTGDNAHDSPTLILASNTVSASGYTDLTEGMYIQLTKELNAGTWSLYAQGANAGGGLAFVNTQAHVSISGLTFGGAGARIGMTRDVAGNVKIFSEPIGGGTRTYLTLASGTDANGTTWTNRTFFALNSATFFTQTHAAVQALALRELGAAGNNVFTLTNVTLTTYPPDPASVTVTPSVAIVNQGGKAQFTATVYDTTGAVITGDTITWASANTAQAAVSGTGLASAQFGSLLSTDITITASDGTYASGTATLGINLANAHVEPRATWANSAIGRYYSPQVIYGEGPTGWETPSSSTTGWPWPPSSNTSAGNTDPTIGIVVVSASTSTSTAPLGIVVQEYANGVLLSTVTPFSLPAWSSASTYLMGLVWDGTSSVVTPYYVVSGSTTTGTAVSVSSNWTSTWNVLNYLGGIMRPSTASTDRLGFFLRNAPSGTSIQPYYTI